MDRRPWDRVYWPARCILCLTWPDDLSSPNLLRMFVFSLQCVMCSVLMEWLHRSRERALSEADARRESESALRKSDALLREQADALRDVARRKDEFLAMLAHELRNPLAALSGAVAISAQSSDPEDVEWSRDSIQRNIKQLARLIDDLLDVSRVTQGKIELRKEKFDASAVIDQAVDSVQYLLAPKGHQIAVSVARGSLWVNADPTRIQQSRLQFAHKRDSVFRRRRLHPAPCGAPGWRSHDQRAR